MEKASGSETGSEKVGNVRTTSEALIAMTDTDSVNELKESQAFYLEE